MSDVGLMFVGAVLFVNGLLFLGRVDAKSAATFNLFVGALQTAIPFYLIATAPNTEDILLDAGIFLFGFTYLYVGISNLAGQKPVLWALFWLVLGLGITRLTTLAGWLTLILSFTTCTIPGYLLLLGEWGHVHTWLVLIVIAATVVALLPIGSRSLRKSPGPTEQAETAAPVSVA